jgi:osmotically-inducible protein OsmY
VTNVHNHLEVVLPPEDYRHDAMLTTAANNALAASATVPVASTSGNTVTLVGHVRTPAQRDAVVDAAWLGHAVMAVINELEITG